jgi:hypothetical protein
MAKITVQIEVDTDEKTMDVSINGEKIKNVSNVSCYKYYDSYEQEDKCSVSIYSCEEDKEAGVTKNTNYYAHGSEQARAIPPDQAINNVIAGFVGVKHIDATKAVAEFLLKKVR